MLQAKCIQKFKKNNHIYAYRLQDFQGNIKDVYSDQLKQAIKNHQISIVNLILTSDNRLVDTTQQKSTATQAKPSKISKEQLQNIIDKAKLLDLPIKEIHTACNHKCYLISVSDTQHMVYIPDDVTKLNCEPDGVFTDNIRDLQGTIKVVGGKNLKDTNTMFMACKAQSIDLSSFDTSKVTAMWSMFEHCQAQSIDLRNFNTSKVTDMYYMFSECQVKYLDLSSFDTSKVADMQFMFQECQAKSLNLSSFDTSNVINMAYMFDACKAQSIDLSNFNTSNVTDMDYMFKGCEAQSIDLRNINTSNIKCMKGMFYNCKAQIKATDPKILKAYQESRM